MARCPQFIVVHSEQTARERIKKALFVAGFEVLAPETASKAAQLYGRLHHSIDAIALYVTVTSDRIGIFERTPSIPPPAGAQLSQQAREAVRGVLCHYIYQTEEAACLKWVLQINPQAPLLLIASIDVADILSREYPLPNIVILRLPCSFYDVRTQARALLQTHGATPFGRAKKSST